MKIAMIGHKRIPSREGGIEIVVEEISKRLVNRGYQVHAYNRKRKQVSDKRRRSHNNRYNNGIRLITIPTINRKGLDALLYSFFATIRALFGRYDIIHFHAEGPCVMLLIPHLFRIRTVVTIHGLDWQRAKWGRVAKKYLLLGEKIAAKYADEVIVLSKNVQEYFLETYQRETIYIPNGVSVPKTVEGDIITEKYGLKKNDYFLFLARIVPEKGLHYLLEAFGMLDTDIKLVVAGGGSHSDGYVKQIEAMAEKDKRVIMTGFVQGKVLEELFSNCRAYILPSDIEGMPLSLLEAMSYKRKCLSSNIRENVEIMKNNGYLFEKGNVKSLLEQLNLLLEEDGPDPGYCEEYDMSIFDWEVISNKYIQLYEKSHERLSEVEYGSR